MRFARSAEPLHDRRSGWKESSTPRIAERGRRAPRARSASRPCRRVNASTIRLVSLYGYVWSTYPGSWSARFLLIAQLSQDASVVRPRAAHFHPDAEVDLAVEETLQVLAGGGGHLLQALAALAEDDRLLAVPLDEDSGLDPPQLALLLEAVDGNLAAIGQLLAERLEQLFAQHLGGEEALVAIGELILGIGGGARGQRLGHDPQELRQVPAGARADRHHGGEV